MTARPTFHESRRRPVYAAIAFALILVAVLLAEGCAGQGSGGTGSKISTLDPQQMVLQVSDLPDGYTLKEEKQINTSQLDPSIWNAKKGYEVMFSKGSHSTGIETITEIILIEPIDKVDQQISMLTEYYSKQGGKYTQLPGPVVGDASTAIIVPGRADRGPAFYLYIFIKKDVVVVLMMNDTGMDTAVLQSIVEIAAAKVQ